jgi:phospholipase C
MPPLDRRRFLQSGMAALTVPLLGGCVSSADPDDDAQATALPAPGDSGIEHLVVVTMENRSFDHMLGWVPGANGRQAGLQYPDRDGVMQKTHRLTPDWQGCGMEDPPHGYDSGRLCVNGGAMDGFLHDEASGDLFPIGYYEADDLPFYKGVAAEYTVCDRYHSGILASTQANRMYVHCGQTDRSNNSGGLFGVIPATSTLPTVWDRAAKAGVSARYYFNNLPYTAIWGAKYLGISRPVASFHLEAAAGLLPAISYVDPFFYEAGLDALCNDDHPFADVRNGQAFVNSIYESLRKSPLWSKTLLVINYDEWGGFFDHVVPPFMPISDEERDQTGNDGQLGIRVPCLLIGPRARRGHVAKQLFEPNSILKFMEWRWGLEPLGVRAAVTNNLAHALDFANPPRTDVPLAFDVPGNLGRTVACGLQSVMTKSMDAHAEEVRALQAKARAAGFRW